jgi:lipopolysaccharide export system protein LptA
MVALAAMAGVAHGAGLSGHNSDAPVNYAADHIQLLDKENRVLLSGNVDITQDDLRVRAARSTVAYTNDGGMKIQRLDATGGVEVSRGDQTARGDVATYDFNRRIITMVGNVVLHRSSDTLNGARLVIDLTTGLSTVDGRGMGAGGRTGGGRVSGSFSVPHSKH